MTFLPEATVKSWSELQFFENSKAVHLAHVDFSSGDATYHLQDWTEFEVKFQPYYQSGYYESFIPDFFDSLRPTGSGPYLPYFSGICMLSDAKGHRLSEPFTFLMAPRKGPRISEMVQQPAISSYQLVSSVKEIAQWSAETAKEIDFASKTHKYSFCNYDMGLNNIVWNDDFGFRIIGYENSCLQLVEDSMVQTVMPNPRLRQSTKAYPIEQRAVKNFCETVLYVVDRKLWFRKEEAKFVDDLLLTLSYAAGNNDDWRTLWQSIKDLPECANG